MDYTRKQYEELINSTTLFTIDKEGRPTEYAREKYRLIENLYCYLMTYKGKKGIHYKEFGCEILETAESCIKAYDSEKGIFLHYFKRSWKKKFDYANGLESERRKTTGREINDKADPHDFVDSIVFTDDVEKLLNQINSTYDDLQERQKKLISELITSKLFSSRYITPKLRDFTFRIIRKNGLSFVSDEMYDYCVSSGKALTQKEIGARNGRTEASVSRTLRNFQDSLNDLIRGSTTG